MRECHCSIVGHKIPQTASKEREEVVWTYRNAVLRKKLGRY